MNDFRSDLTGLCEGRFTGALRIEGTPAGVMYLREGLIAAITTPGAPGPESLLLKSGRITEREWSAAFAAGAAEERVGEELTNAAGVSAAELEVVAVSALYDAAFVLGLNRPERWHAEPGTTPLPLPVRPGVHPGELLRETRHRLSSLSQQWGSPQHLAAQRVTATGRATPSAVPNTRFRDILLHANGRHTPRDIAFLLGRGTFAVTTDIVSMAHRGLLDGRPAPSSAGAAGAAIRQPTRQEGEGHPAVDHPGVDHPGAAPPAQAPAPVPPAALPRRRPRHGRPGAGQHGTGA
ncbi:hypothetical protein JK364_49715 [Streptomyces sp. 110]|uniref:DUF4388 domain-containing protein n=1 Tax=Streptomyces endocoffeicus TaxID=2898945 RepID=A0ABS1Q6N0_9ACTN|nr:hypothetical protein [Streptomyces endocoffeicus]MBL1120317.1 hypothetical protein [Streptomyces endocoffeicus]